MLKINMEILRELFRMCTLPVCGTLSMILGTRVNIEEKEAENQALKETGREILCPSVVASIRLESGQKTVSQLFILPESLVKMSAGLVMGTESGELDDIVMSTMKEIISQSMEAVGGAVREFLGKELHVQLMGLSRMKNRQEFDTWCETLEGDQGLLVSWEIYIDGAGTSVIYGVLPQETLILLGMAGLDAEKDHAGSEIRQGRRRPSVAVNNVRFPEFKVTENEVPAARIDDEREHIREISMDVAIQVGTAVCTVKDILNLEEGQLLILDKQAGSPANVLANGRFVAKGDVFVMDDRFAARITEIVSKRG